MKKQNFVITGMTCSACSSRVEKCVSALDGTSDVSVNLLTNSMRLSYDENITGEDEIIQTVIRAGYGAAVKNAGAAAPTAQTQQGSTPQEQQIRNLKFRFIVSLCLLIPLMYISMNHMIYSALGIDPPGFMLSYFHGDANAVTFAFSQFLLLLPIVWLNRAYFEVGFRTLIHRSPNMDSLIAVGASAAIIYGIFVIFRLSYGLGHGDAELVSRYSMDIYFESAGTILTLITLGKFLEAKSKGKTSEAIEELMDSRPENSNRGTKRTGNRNSHRTNRGRRHLHRKTRRFDPRRRRRHRGSFRRRRIRHHRRKHPCGKKRRRPSDRRYDQQNGLSQRKSCPGRRKHYPEPDYQSGRGSFLIKSAYRKNGRQNRRCFRPCCHGDRRRCIPHLDYLGRDF